MKRLRRKSDGMVLGWNQEMAKNPELEEFDDADEKIDDKKAAEYAGTGEGPLVEGVATELGYPATGKAPHPLAPFGAHTPTPDEAHVAGLDPSLGKEPMANPLHDDGGLEHLFTGPSAEEQAQARDTTMTTTGKTS